MDPAQELANLKFKPTSSAWKHMQKFERLCQQAYPRATDAMRWSLFVKTIDTNPPTWGNRPGQMTPSRWLMELSEEWIRDNPPCDDPSCDECKNDAMSFDFLKNAFLDRWGDRREMPQPPPSSKDTASTMRHDRHDRHHGHQRAYSMPPPDSESGSEINDSASAHPMAMVPAHVAQNFPPAAPTPPNEPVSDRERLVQETKTSIAINADQGSGQIVLSITNNKQKKRKSKTPIGAIENGDSPSRAGSPPPSAPPPPQQEPKPQVVQVIEADPDREAYLDHMDRYRDGSPPPPVHHRGGSMGEASHRYIDPRMERGGMNESPPPSAHGGRHGPASHHGGRGRLDSPPLHGPPHRSHSLHHAHSQALTRPPTPPVDDRALEYLPPMLAGSPGMPPPLRPRLLEGKICAITGASRGIGRAIALGFAKEGAHIVAHYWGTKADPANEEIVSLCVAIRGMGQGCTIVFGDIADPRTSEAVIRRAVESYGRLDVAVGNAGMCWFRDMFDVNPELLRRHVDVNLNGNFFFVQAAARQFKRQFHDIEAEAEPGRDVPMQDYAILCVSSSTTGAGMAHFSPTAAGVRELMKTCAVSLGKYGVRCNTLSPGIVQTKMVHEELMDMEKRGAMEKRVPLGRLGVPGDVVGPAVWLASDMGRWVTGAEIRVDGGSGVNV